ncbi:MAG: gamma-glutamyltransferase [Candidatus Cloacimonetes bacterium]|nr:gamma-glutamyltransferase [Candidatus Cloacimonadota bacterium]
MLNHLFLLLSISSFLYSQEIPDPEANTGIQSKTLVTAHKFMISAAHPLAAKAGYSILSKGGSAVDALVATQLMLGLVEPQSSGIGGGAFVLFWDQAQKTLHSYDGRETAPKSADEFHFFQNNKALSWNEAFVGGNSVGSPGVLHTLYQLQQRWGRLPWPELFDETIVRAKQGFEVSHRLSLMLEQNINPGLSNLSPAREYFYPDGVFLKQGDIRTNPKYADILQKIALHGPDAFYQGENAQDLVNTVINSPINPGKLSLADLKEYKAIERKPLCLDYYKYKICGIGPPGSGTIAIFQILEILKHFPKNKFDSVLGIHLFAQASRLAFADRDYYLADSDFVSVPVEGLLDPKYLLSRSRLIDPLRDNQLVEAGMPAAAKPQIPATAPEFENTSHVSIVDVYGNAISMTSSIEYAFGSALMVNGYLLNNQLTDFSLTPSQDNHLVANRVEPKKRPRSSMAPIMVFDQDQNLVYITGSPGGSRIISYLARNLIAVLDWGMDIQDAANLPHVTHRNDYLALEKDTSITEFTEELNQMGYKTREVDLNSGIHAIQITSEGLVGAADPRREGMVLGGKLNENLE